MSKLKTFRGQIKNDGKQKVVLHTNTGAIGYRFRKFQLMPKTPNNATEEALVTVWSTSSARDSQVGITSVNFASQELLCVAFFSSAAAATTNPEDITVVFDQVTFNQDIYITCASSGNMNWYMELEQVKLDVNENTVATLKDIRNVAG